MDHESDGADECQPTASNTNVRVKVSSWVTNFVNEMRTKSPAVVQRWVDSLPNESVADIVPDDIAVQTDNPDDIACHKLNDTGNFCVKNCESPTQNKNESNVNDIIKPVNELNVHVHINEGGGSEGDGNYTRTTPRFEIDECEKQHTHIAVAGVGEHANSERHFWQKGATVLTALRIRSTTSTQNSNHRNNIETQDLSTSHQLLDSDTHGNISTSTKPLINKSKLNDIYCKLSINKKRYNFIKDRKMDAKKLLNDAKSRLLAAANWDESEAIGGERVASIQNESMASGMEQSENVANLPVDPIKTATITATTIISEPETSGNVLAVCDTTDMDLSADELSSRLSQSNDILSADDEDSFNVSMPSIDSHHTTHLNVSRRIAMVDIGRSTSDNPRLRNKYYLADIGRSFSEHQDDEAIIIGERNISAPSSSIAIQNINRSNGNFFERRAYSVSPTHRGLKRGILSRDHSLSDSSRHRNQLSKGNSFQSDSSHCSSVESLLDARKPDSEAILRQLGFGPAHQEDLLSRIPKRFLKPSQVPGIDTEAFMRQQQIASNLHEQSILGYRGLTGDPHVLPSVIVAKIMERFQLSEENSTKLYDVFNDGRPMSAPPTPGPNDLADIRHPGP